MPKFSDGNKLGLLPNFSYCFVQIKFPNAAETLKSDRMSES